MEQKIIHEYLDAKEIEQYFEVLEIILQCREMERRLTAQRMTNTTTDQTSNAKKHMALIFHAHICQARCQQERCHIQHCGPIQNVLAHIPGCQMGEECSVKYCRTARHLTMHYESCYDQWCPVCAFACKANGYEHTRPRPFFYQNPNVHVQNNGSPCGAVDCYEFVCNPFRMHNPPNKIGPKTSNKTSSITAQLLCNPSIKYKESSTFPTQKQ